MNISLKWLNDYVDVQEFFQKSDELAKLLTSAGLEVEGIEDLGKRFNHVVVGQIIELGKHPNADKLTLCQVDVGDGKQRQIVCGAKNHKQGDKVVVALPGAILPGDFAIKLSKIRDVESQGMLCSETELGLNDKSEGIVILPKDAKVGAAFAEHAGLQDVILTINVTPNRADCLSHIGLAREISCLLDRTMKMPEAKIKAGTQKVSAVLDVKLNDDTLCPRYCGRAIFGVNVGPSPAWLRSRLEAVGMKSINNVVDVTNYAMMEFGQPLHAFDLAELKGKKVLIEKSKAGEKFKTFDGTEIELTGEELTIRDGERAVALAGVIGGLNSGVTEKTKDIFLEAAHFNPRGVRRAARKHGIETDSAFRFSRGTDVSTVDQVMNRAAQLIAELAGGSVSPDFVDLYPKPMKKIAIEVRKQTLEDRLGYKVDMDLFSTWMKRLHCEIKVSADKAIVTPPGFRVDLDIEMDFVEEFARLNGYDKIHETFPILATRPTDDDVRFINEKRVTELFTREGFSESKNYNFIADKWQESLVEEKSYKAMGVEMPGSTVRIQNPLSEETGVMRKSILPGLLTNLLHNYRHGNTYGRFFEVGFVFGKKESSYKESHRVGIVGWGQRQGLWNKTDRPVVYDLKGAMDGLLRRLRGTGQWRQVKAADVPPFIHPGQVAGLFYEGKMIGFVGTIHPMFRDEHKLRHDVAVGEFDLEALMRGQPRSPKAQRISKFPAVERDMALLMPRDLAVSEIVREVEKLAAPLVQSVEVFDVFMGQGISDTERSVALRMVLQDMEATLSEETLVKVGQTVVSGLQKKFPVRLR